MHRQTIKPDALPYHNIIIPTKNDNTSTNFKMIAFSVYVVLEKKKKSQHHINVPFVST